MHITSLHVSSIVSKEAQNISEKDAGFDTQSNSYLIIFEEATNQPFENPHRGEEKYTYVSLDYFPSRVPAIF